MDIRFGNLTTQSGQKINFENFDKDGDGKINEQEYNAALAEYGLDSVELSNVDKNGDKNVSNEEFQIWEQKIKMEEALKPYQAKVTTDFIGKNSQYASDMTKALNEWIDTFADEYANSGKEIANMATEFEAALPAKYSTIKSSILSNSPDAVKSKVLDDVLEAQVIESRANGMSEDATKIMTKQLGKSLEQAADNFIKNYKGDNLEADLKAYLNEYMGSSDAAKIGDDVSKYQEVANSFGGYIDSAELETLKETALELLTAAVNNGVPVVLNGYKYSNANVLKTVVASYTDADKLKADMETFISSIGSTSVLEASRSAAEDTAAANEEAKFTNIKGSEYKVDPSQLDYSGIDGYYENKEYKVKGKKSQATLKERLEDQLREVINGQLKEQMRAQINAMLLEKGVPADKIDTIFENVFNASMNEVFDAEGVISTKNKTWFRKGHAKCNIKDVVDKFVTTFNTKIETIINTMNASNTDFDTADIDYTVLGENYQNYIQNEAQKSIKVEKVKAYAEEVINSLNATMMQKAKALCEANGVKFDMAVFTTMFNNSRGTAISNSVLEEKLARVRRYYFETAVLVNNFVADFTKNYSEWVAKEKKETK